MKLANPSLFKPDDLAFNKTNPGLLSFAAAFGNKDHTEVSEKYAIYLSL